MPAPDSHARGRLGQPRRSRRRGSWSASSRSCSPRRPDLVVVPGDVNSTIAAALAAAKLGIPVAHVEAGLRSFDRTMPEEINRIVTDQLAELLFIHSPRPIENLRAEGIAGRARSTCVGNVMIDTLVALRSALPRRRRPPAGLGRRARRLRPRDPAPPGPRRRARCSPQAVAAARRRSPRELPVVFPVHPRTRAMHGGEIGASTPACGSSSRSATSTSCPCIADAARRPDRLRRHPGGDDRPRRPLPHPARQHRAAGHDHRRHQHPGRPRPRRDLRQIPPALAQRAAMSHPNPRRSGTATRPSGSRDDRRERGRGRVVAGGASATFSSASSAAGSSAAAGVVFCREPFRPRVSPRRQPASPQSRVPRSRREPLRLRRRPRPRIRWPPLCRGRAACSCCGLPAAARLDHGELAEVLEEALQQRPAPLGMGLLAAAEHDRHLDLVLVLAGSARRGPSWSRSRGWRSSAAA